MFKTRRLSLFISTICALSATGVGHAYTYIYTNSNYAANTTSNTVTHTYSYSSMDSFSNSTGCSNVTTTTSNGAQTAAISACPVKEKKEIFVNENYVVDHYSQYRNNDCGDGANAGKECAQTPAYSITKLAGMSVAKAINNKGEVTGMIAPGFTYDGKYHAGIWRSGQIVDLGMIGCRPTVAQCWSQGFGINEHGQVVGESHVPDTQLPGYSGYWGVYYAHETVWNSVTPMLLDTLGTEWGTAMDINDKGTIVGHSRSTNWSMFSGDYLNHAFFKQGDVIKEIGGAGQASKAYAVNERDEVAGEIKLTEGLRAFLWKDDTVTVLGHLGGNESIGRDIANNERAKLVGYSKTAGGTFHGFLWREGVMTDLGTLFGAPDSYAFAINEKGQIVGRSGRRAVLWHNGQIFDLNALIPANSGVVLMTAVDINERGQIIVQAKDGGQYLLTPSN